MFDSPEHSESDDPMGEELGFSSFTIPKHTGDPRIVEISRALEELRSVRVPSEQMTFGPTRYSDYEMSFHVVTRPTTIADVRKVAAAFDIRDIAEISQAGAAEVVSQNYKVTTDDGASFLVKRCPVNGAPSHLEALRELFEFLHEEELPIPHLRSKSNGEFIESLDGVSWVAYEFIDSARYFRGGLDELREVGAVIGKLDSALKKFTEQVPEPKAVACLKANTGFLSSPLAVTEDTYDKLLQLALTQANNPYKTLLEATEDSIRKAFHLRDKVFEHAQNSPQHIQLIHNDLHSHNILIAPSGPSIIDFDIVILRSVYSDIGFATHRLVRQAAHYKEEQLRDAQSSPARKLVGADIAELRDAFLSSYQQTNPEVDVRSPLVFGHSMEELLQCTVFHLREIYQNHNTSWCEDLPLHLQAPGELARIFSA